MSAVTLDRYEGLLDERVWDFLRTGRFLHLIDGELRSSQSGRTFPVEDPATGAIIGEAARGGEQDVDAAVAAARAAVASPAWRSMSPAERGARMMKLADIIEEHAEACAQLDSLDSGKPVAAAASYDIPSAIAWLRYFAGWPDKIEGLTIPGRAADRLIYTRREPVGVVAQIIPWNFPLMMAAWKLAPALSTGCAVVLKPAEQTPLSASYLAKLILESDLFPPGVINIVFGYGEDVGAALVSHPHVAKVAFTGSQDTAEKIIAASAKGLKRVSLELGGKSPNIVLPDVDPNEVAPFVADAAFLNQGENCCAGTRLYVHKSIFDDVVGGVCDRARGMKLGPGLKPTTEMGPLVSQQQYDVVLSYLDRGSSEGCDVLCGGSRPEGMDEGWFVEPTVFHGKNDAVAVAREEIFGPVLLVSAFDSIEEVVRRANDTEYGLAAGVWTNDVAAAHRVAAQLDAGTVWVNTYNETDPAVPFGGFKGSGFGREHGHEVLDQYLETKAVWVNVS